ncbi:hypothetical protein HY030_04555 [Candidatus Gottesmanbacteria bacterium]|nr:hypothetical protein [Candidatus Gottesmanbacteria bacterium]
MKKNNLKTLIQNEPLIEAEPTLTAIKPNLINQKKGSIFFGVGIMSKDKLSKAVPFDILAMFFTAELLRRELNFSEVIVLVADSHALSNNIFSRQKIELVTTQTIQTLQKIIINFKLLNFKLLVSSQIAKEQSFQEIVSKLPEIPNQYLTLEIADCLFLQKQNNLRLKLGWTMRKDNEEMGNDERFFDQKIKELCPFLSFVHLKPGRTFDQNRQRVSPYLSILGETRLLLRSGESIKDKINLASKSWNDPNFGGTLRHLANIVRVFEKLFGSLGNKSLEEKIQMIIHKSLK